MKNLNVIKIGGNIVDNPEALEDFIGKFSSLKGNKILIHGGGVLASRMSAQLGIETKMHNGRRITDAETLRLVTMVYAGWINKSVVASLQAAGCNAIGLSGADCNAVPATKRPPIPVDFGFVGDVDPSKINAEGISKLIEAGFCPVFCAITHDGEGTLLNTNADTMAQSVAVAMSKYYDTDLFFCFEKEGVLYDKDDDTSVIPEINREKFHSLLEQKRIADGMIPKLENAFKAIESGVKAVHIMHARNLGRGIGTKIK